MFCEENHLLHICRSSPLKVIQSCESRLSFTSISCWEGICVAKLAFRERYVKIIMHASMSAVMICQCKRKTLIAHFFHGLISNDMFRVTDLHVRQALQQQLDVVQRQREVCDAKLAQKWQMKPAQG